LAWGSENRTTALRGPSGAPAARRIEHRVAGGDVNPYLLVASILGAALTGIEGKLTPPAPTHGNAYDAASPHLPTTWGEAIAAFEDCQMTAQIFPRELVANYLATKRQEMHYMAELSPEEQMQLYLDTV
jgi:glutamine synthetase